MLGEFPERYTVEEKLSIIQAYKKGGGVAGLAEIIDDEDDDEDDDEVIEDDDADAETEFMNSLASSTLTKS